MLIGVLGDLGTIDRESDQEVQHPQGEACHFDEMLFPNHR